MPLRDTWVKDNFDKLYLDALERDASATYIDFNPETNITSELYDTHFDFERSYQYNFDKKNKKIIELLKKLKLCGK